jgi:hypothetical protein
MDNLAYEFTASTTRADLSKVIFTVADDGFADRQ